MCLSVHLYAFVPKVAKSPTLLQGLSEHLILAYVVVTDRPPGKSHCFLEMILPDLRHWVIIIILTVRKREMCEYA